MKPLDFILSISSGVRRLLYVLIVLFVANVVGNLAGLFDLVKWMGLSGAGFWHGHIWTVFIYWLLPANVFELISAFFLLVFFGARLEQNWSARELWTFCFISALGSAVGKVLLASQSPVLLVGFCGVNFGLLAAGLKLFGNEEICLMGIGKISMRNLILVMVLLSLAFSIFQNRGGILTTLISLCGGLFAWVYLSLRWKWNREMQSQTNQSQRMNRLEL